ncbi:MAG: hypothetical protein ABI655_08130 [Phenylobacterium sp.]
MILGLSVEAFTTLHLIIGLVAIAAGLGFLAVRRYHPAPAA